jgi:polyisoprenoid-binding protein YceI
MTYFVALISLTCQSILSYFFKSAKVEVADGNHFKVTGDLANHGITRTVTLDVEADLTTD